MDGGSILGGLDRFIAFCWGIADDCLVVIHLKLYRFRLRIVKDGRVFQGLNTLTGRRAVFAVALADMYFHGNLLQVVQRVEYLTQYDDRLHAQIHEEGNGGQCQHSRKAWCANEALYLLADSQTVVPTGIEAGIGEQGSQELSHRDRGPYHDDGQTHEPLEQVDLVGSHHV